MMLERGPVAFVRGLKKVVQSFFLESSLTSGLLSAAYSRINERVTMLNTLRKRLAIIIGQVILCWLDLIYLTRKVVRRWGHTFLGFSESVVLLVSRFIFRCQSWKRKWTQDGRIDAGEKVDVFSLSV